MREEELRAMLERQKEEFSTKVFLRVEELSQAQAMLGQQEERLLQAQARSEGDERLSNPQARLRHLPNTGPDAVATESLEAVGAGEQFICVRGAL